MRTSKTVGGDTTDYVLDPMATLPVVVSHSQAVYLYGQVSGRQLSMRPG